MKGSNGTFHLKGSNGTFHLGNFKPKFRSKVPQNIIGLLEPS